MKKNNIVLMAIAIITLISFVAFASYAYLSLGTKGITNIGNVNAISERNNMVFDTTGGAMALEITAASMQKANVNSVAAQNNATLTVNFTANTPYSMVCSYDIVYEWTSTNRYTAHSTGVDDWEFTIKALLTKNVHVYEGDNHIKIEQDLSSFAGNNNSVTVVSGATIDGTGNTTSTAVWNLSSKFYNADGNQNGLSNKTYAGRFKVDNVSCKGGEVEKLRYWYKLDNVSYTYPANGGTLQTTGTATSSNYYMAQDDHKYYVCIIYDGKEVCLSQPYTQYAYYSSDASGTSTFSSVKLKNRVSNALLQAFEDAGLASSVTSYQESGSTSVSFAITNDSNNLRCGIRYNGYVFCKEGSSSSNNMCRVNSSGTAICGN